MHLTETKSLCALRTGILDPSKKHCVLWERMKMVVRRSLTWGLETLSACRKPLASTLLCLLHTVVLHLDDALLHQGALVMTARMSCDRLACIQSLCAARLSNGPTAAVHAAEMFACGKTHDAA